jgi:hypothetical protein
VPKTAYKILNLIVGSQQFYPPVFPAKGQGVNLSEGGAVFT